ncbi:PadR family transcriptional regulator [Nostocoides sp. Soil756]|jgi:DNA-binding PadR family transcriptional regulator|uniref:PadR family transcriptional regulator n=1 Tax=Nostocoides sp. Soil756 TaxID=1736399 RepID=UPI0006FC82B6|nr:PadR family transcriptional regulator [Tetrasphaera sp. Soil756]KRE60395.1 PadR family transcriptional regulator [Tetrasphaera sp. Soil756]
MSVRLGLMALLAEGESYGARLRSEFEERTGGTWPLNVGQVYTTLERLVRDGLVEQTGEADSEGRIGYRLTDAGRAELDAWWATPVDRTSTPRDELTIKLALAVTAPGVDVERVVQSQRTSTLRHLRDLTRLKRDALGRAEGTAEGVAAAQHGLAWLLVLENLVFAAEAEVRWLDHVESTLARHAVTVERAARAARATTSSASDTGSTVTSPGATPALLEGNPS